MTRPPLPSYVVIIVTLLCLFISSCSKNKRQDTLSKSVIAVNVARDGFTAWDRQHQQAIVDAATSREDGEAQLASYRERRRPVVEGFELAYRVLAVAATQNDDPSLNKALTAAAELVDAVTKLMGGQ